MIVAAWRLSARAAWFWIAATVLLVALLALAFSDLSSGVMRAAAEWQAHLDWTIRMQLRMVGSDEGGAALWTLTVTGFVYGVMHTLGPGHGKTVVVAYFLDGTRKRGWIDGILAGSWISVTHTAAALVLAAILMMLGRVGAFSAQGQARVVELTSFGLIFAIGLWRLHAGLTGRLHDHDHGHGDDHDHHHGHTHGHDHDGSRHHPHGHHHAPVPSSAWRRFFRFDTGLGLLTAAGVAPCAGAVVMVLFASIFGVLWAGLLGVLAIAVGMAGTLSVLGIASMLAHHVLVGEQTSNVIGRLTTIGAALVVIATSGSMLFLALYRMFGT